MILTRFSRVTFHAAHRYLGLTSEVLRTEKAINDLACHPLPASFYDSGGLQSLRQRFDGRSSDNESDYFVSHSPIIPSPKPKSGESSRSSSRLATDRPSAPLANKKRQHSLPFSRGTRDNVQAGDLLVASGSANDRPSSRSYSLLNTPRIPRDSERERDLRNRPRSSEDFDLREEVMSCIAKSIGLLQPPWSKSDSAEPSPAIVPVDPRRSHENLTSPFGSLSLLDGGDDTSSLTASSITSTGGYMSGLDNEVEILFFAKGSTLARAGELNTGKSTNFGLEAQYSGCFQACSMLLKDSLTFSCLLRTPQLPIR